MIARNDILSLNYIKKTPFLGSHRGMRFRLSCEETDGEKALQAIVWPEPFAFDKTAEEKKESRSFPFSEEGMTEAIAWMNERYEEISK